MKLYSQACNVACAIDVWAPQDVIVNSSYKPELAGTLQDFHARVTSIECKPAPSFNKTL